MLAYESSTCSLRAFKMSWLLSFQHPSLEFIAWFLFQVLIILLDLFCNERSISSIFISCYATFNKL